MKCSDVSVSETFNQPVVFQRTWPPSHPRCSDFLRNIQKPQVETTSGCRPDRWRMLLSDTPAWCPMFFFFLLKQMSISHKHTTKRFPASHAKSPRRCWKSKLIVADAQGVGFPHCSGIQWGLWTSFLQPSSFYCIVINKYYLFQRNNNLKRKQRCWEKTVLKVFANESVSIILGGWLICDRVLV